MGLHIINQSVEGFKCMPLMDNRVNLNNFTNTNNTQSIINVSQLQMMHCNIMAMMILERFEIFNPIVPILQV